MAIRRDRKTMQFTRGRSAGARARRLLASLSVALAMTAMAAAARAESPTPGGFVESATGGQVRARVMPPLPARGPFTFPEPYNTTGVRLTNADDCGGADCVNYVGYSYWRNTNNHVGSDTMLIFLSLDRQRGGNGPTLLSYDKTTDQVEVVGPLFSARSPAELGHGRRVVLERLAGDEALRQSGQQARALRRDRADLRDGVRCRPPLRRRQVHLADALERRRPRALGDAQNECRLLHARLRRLRRDQRRSSPSFRRRAPTTSARSTAAAGGS